MCFILETNFSKIISEERQRDERGVIKGSWYGHFKSDLAAREVFLQQILHLTALVAHRPGPSFWKSRKRLVDL